MKKNKLPYLTQLIKTLAPKVGARVVIEPEWKVVGQIVYLNGVVKSFHFYSIDLNPLASSKIAKDKHIAKIFLKKAGYPVAEGQTIFEKSWAKAVKSERNISYAVKYAKKLGYPLIVKPNEKSQGEKVTLVSNAKELSSTLRDIFQFEKVAIVERYMPGYDYRIVVLSDLVISAYQRMALSVIGDGKSSILKLLKNKQLYFTLRGRDTKINFSDERIKMKLQRQGFSFKSILPKVKRIFLLDNANLSTGGDAAD